MRLVIILAFILCACENHVPIHFIDDFYSYQSQQDVIGITPDVQFSGKKKGLSKGQIAYNHLSEDGELGFLFYEDQLVSVGFYPKDTLAYFNKLEGEVGKLKEGKNKSRDRTIIYKGLDQEMGSIGGAFVSWSDSTLIVKYENKVW